MEDNPGGPRFSGFSLYLIGSLFPFTSVMVCWAIFYSFGHFREDRLLTISETVIPFPENRIFAVTMNIESVLLIIMYRIRNNVIKALSLRNSVPIKFKQLIISILTILVPIGMSALSALTLVDNIVIHLSGAFMFFYGSIFYYLISDSALASVGCKPKLISRIVSYSAFIFTFPYLILLTYQDPFIKSLGAVFQYLVALLCFVKIFLFYFDLPKHSLNLVLEKEKKE